MKRTVCILLVLMLVCSVSVFAYADGIDLKQMTTDELLELRMQLNEELSERFQAEPAPFYNGTYIVGKDIKAGQYILQFLEKSDESWYFYVETRYADRPEVSYKNDPNLIYQMYNEGETGFIGLEEGMVLEVVGALTMTIEPNEGSFWKP